MPTANDVRPRRESPPPTRKRSISGTQAALLAIVAIAVTVVAINADTSESEIARSPDPAPGTVQDSEAVQRFLELHRQLRQASRERNLSALSQVVTSDSPLIRVAERDIRQLINDGVIDKSGFENEDVDVTSTSSDLVSITQIVTIHPRFVDANTGKQLKTSVPLRQTVRWTLRREHGQWKIHDAIVISSEEYESE